MKTFAVATAVTLSCLWPGYALAVRHSPRLLEREAKRIAALTTHAEDEVEADDEPRNDTPARSTPAKRAGWLAPTWGKVALVMAASSVAGGLYLEQATVPQFDSTIVPPPHGKMTALQQHVYYFKTDRANQSPDTFLDDPLTTKEMTQRARELGLAFPTAAAIALFSDGTIGALTRGCPFTGIGMGKISKGMHAPVHSGIFDNDGNFNEAALKDLFKQYAGGRKFITRSELQKMTDDRYALVSQQFSIFHPYHWWYKLARFGSNGEWDALLKARRYKVGDELAIRYKDLRAFFVDASLLYKIREENGRGR